jgi:hypothetical protein
LYDLQLTRAHFCPCLLNTQTLFRKSVYFFLTELLPFFKKKISHELAVRSPGRGGVAAAVVEDEGHVEQQV